MPRHRRSASGSHHHYTGQLSNTMSTAAMYSQQPQRTQVPAGYYTIPGAADSAILQVPGAQQVSYDPYQTETSSLPLTQHRSSSGAWSAEDDRQLIAARKQGLNWGQIKDSYFPSKSANACRKRHERLMERKGADDWDTRKLQHLAKEYMGMRKEIWSGLAARTGEKWNVVEAKCMSNGLKNLQSAARAASRRDRLETSSHTAGYDDDSGISGIGLTPVGELDASYSSPDTGSSVGAPHSFSSSSAASSVGYHLHGHAATSHLRPVDGSGDQSPYITMGAYGISYGSHCGYSSSVSSSSVNMGQRYGGSRRDSHSPYVDAHNRVSTADLGIDTSVRRSSHRFRK